MVKGTRLSMTVAVVLTTIVLSACSQTQSDDPKQVVIAMFGAMEKDDKAALIRLLDIPELMKETGTDYATQSGQPRVWTNPEQILEDLTGDGQTKTVWFKHQRIVNAAKITGESATVEVTFMNKETSRAYLTKFGLHKKHDKWLIYSFNTVEQRSQSAG